MKLLKRRLARLEGLLPTPEPAEDPARLSRWRKVVGRLGRLLDRAVPLMTEAERGRVGEALGRLREGGGPYAGWLRHLREGRCRLPELPAAVMKDLLLAWLSPEADGGMVCRGCGLEYPRHKAPPLSEWRLLPGKWPLEGPPPWFDLPELFTACPGCGGSRFEADWPHLVEQYDRPWMRLDGYVGRPRIARA